jgi:hypothetical protein
MVHTCIVLDDGNRLVRLLTTNAEKCAIPERGAAHDQLVVYEEGRGDGHPEADALVHVQLTYGLACCRSGSLLRNGGTLGSAATGLLTLPRGMRGNERPTIQGLATGSAGR